jgi:hypothetical protein
MEEQVDREAREQRAFDAIYGEFEPLAPKVRESFQKLRETYF